MKKTIAMLLACAAAPVFAGTPETVVAPAPTPAPQVNPWSAELGVSYSWASTDVVKEVSGDKAGTLGVDLTACYALTDADSLNIRFGYGWGYADVDGVDTNFHTFTLMPGYRYTYKFDDQWSAYAGVNVGVAAVNFNAEYAHDEESDSAWGFAYSAEIGVRYAIQPNMEIFLGYIFSGNTAQPKGDGWKCEAQNNHGVRVGLGYKF